MMNKIKNGWLFRWWNHLKCGAIYGHKYKLVAESIGGRNRAYECIYCGKCKAT